MKVPHKTLERKLLASGYEKVIGIDEVGMGCLAGPVVVCAVAFDKKFFQQKHQKLSWLRDSKLLLPHQREKFAAELLKEKSLHFRIAYCFSKTIDKINIYQAARMAMKRAVKRLVSKSAIRPTLDPRLVAREFSSGCMADWPKVVVLVDGPHKIPGIDFEQIPVVKGDRNVFAIACASILAKVFRDKMMCRYAKKFPGYGFEKHKGYGTKAHLAKLAKLGPCAIHRQSFAPVGKLI